MQKLISYSAAIILLAVIAYAFFLTGSPARTRKINEDEATLVELEGIHIKLMVLKYSENGVLPKTLDASLLSKAPVDSYDCSFQRDYSNYDPVDAAIATKYDYMRTAKGYSICATFGTNWEDLRFTNDRYVLSRFSWAKNFTQGKYCFERTIPECKKKSKK